MDARSEAWQPETMQGMAAWVMASRPRPHWPGEKLLVC